MEKVSVICSDSDEAQNLSNTFRCVMRKGNCFEFVHSFVHFYQNEMNIINPKKKNPIDSDLSERNFSIDENCIIVRKAVTDLLVFKKKFFFKSF